MTLGNMRAQGVRSLSVSCWQCHHGGVLSVDRWPDDVHVPSFGNAVQVSWPTALTSASRPVGVL
jgi:hypothetical protein